jgi:outer membrane protein assembly factor BamD (BamD/ComL family)
MLVGMWQVMQKKWHEQDEMKAKAAMNKLNDIVQKFVFSLFS